MSLTTNADINASVDKTGASGDWELETAIGDIETGSIFKSQIATAYQYTLDDGDFDFTSSELNFEEVDFTEDRFDVNDIDEQNLGIFAEEGVSFEPVEPAGVEDIDFGSVPEEDFGVLAESGLNFEPVELEEINQIDFNDVPAEDLSLIAEEDFQFQQLNTEDINQINFSSVPADELGILAGSGLDLSELNSEDINTIDFTSIPAENLSLLANSGLNFEQLNTEGVSAIDFNSIPASDIGILADSGLNLDKASNEVVNNVRLGVAADFGYIDEAAFNTNSLSADTTFGELSSTVLNNANLFNYKGDLNLEDGFSIAEAGLLDSSDYQAIDLAFDGDSIFDSSYYLEQNSDVAGEGVNPFTQYFVTGATEGRDPSVYFDSSYYLEEYPDVANEGVNPLLQYFNTGADELFRDPDPAFDTSFYLEEYPDVAESGNNPLLQYANTGASEGRFANETFKTFEESGQAWVIYPDITVEEFESFKSAATKQFGLNKGDDDKPNLFGLLWSLAVGTVDYVFSSQFTEDALEQADNLQQLVEDAKVFIFPKNEPLNDGGNIETFDPPNVDFGTPPYDLGEPIGLEDSTFFPNKDDSFLRDLLDGKFEFPNEGEISFTYFNSIEGNTYFREVEIADEQGKTLGEFDVIDLQRQIFVENKTAKGLDRINPKTGLPAQTPEQFVNKQIVGKTRARITRLNEQATTTVPTKNGTQIVPELAEIIDIKEFVFRLEGDTPKLRNAVEDGLNVLRQEFPDYKFSAEFGE